jgi:predicted Fe-S protein YdhL (DUF1289 family)
MYTNPEYDVQIKPVMPQGTNSTAFTECCGVAICDDEGLCPGCKRKVVGWDAQSISERRRIRWESATRFWSR